MSTTERSCFVLAATMLVAACGAHNAAPPESPPAAHETPSPSPSPAPISEAAPCPNALPSDANDAVREQPPLDVAAIPSYAHVSPSGLGSCVVRPGSGHGFPTPDDRVTVHYVGWTTDGVMFDNAIRRTATFPLRAVIAGWTEGVGMMTPGEVRRLWIPESLAYRGRRGAPAGMLVFDVELIRVEPADASGR